MSVRKNIRSLTFHGGKVEWEGLFGEELVQWIAKFRLDLLGDDTACGGIVTGTPDDCGSALEWDKVPPGDEQFLSNLERFVSTAFRMSVHVGIVVKPVSLDEVESEYLAEEDQEDEARITTEVTAEEIEADIARRESEPKAEPSGSLEADFFGTLRRLRKGAGDR